MSRSSHDPSPDDDPVDSDDAADDSAIGVETFVRQESGEWLVDIAVAFPDGVVRHNVNKYRTERHAQIAAHWIKRAASRNIEGPDNG